MERFKDLGICEHVLRVISDKKFEKPSEIQEKTIPIVLQGKDLIAGSKTGSGKTLAFGAGIIKNANKGSGIQALILTPTRELCEQVAEALEEFSYHKKLTVASVYGGVSIENQIKKLAYADIIVATPGRLLDHLNRKSADLSKVSFLVLDEADRMWDMGFKDDVEKIVNSCPKNRQTLLFSATITGELADFSSKHMKSPVEVSVENYVDESKLKQIYYDVKDDEKFSLLVHLLKNEDSHLVMIFCNTRMNADFVANNLKSNGVNAQVIHGGLTQNKRSNVLERFDNSTVNVMVCTDVAARGLDISGVSHVYNYDLPSDHKDYVHRIGRTARAGKEGIAVNILASRDYENFSNIQRRNSSLKIERVNTPKFEKIFVKMERRNSSFGGGRDRRDSRQGGSSSGSRFGSGRGKSGGSRFGDGQRSSSSSRFGSSPRRTEGQRDNRRDSNSSVSERKSFGGRSEGPRSFGGRSRDSSQGGERRSFGGRSRDSSQGGERRSFGGRSEGQRSFGDRARNGPRSSDGQNRGGPRRSDGQRNRDGPRSSDGKSGNFRRDKRR